MVENEEYAAFLRRGIRAMGRRAACDVDALVLLRGLERDVDEALAAAVAGLHDGAHFVDGAGFSYGEIAQRLGVTRQAVQKRWGGPGETIEEEVEHGTDG